MDTLTPPPVVAVHLVITYQAACHTCDWRAPATEQLADAEQLGDRHQCEGTP